MALRIICMPAFSKHQTRGEGNCGSNEPLVKRDVVQVCDAGRSWGYKMPLRRLAMKYPSLISFISSTLFRPRFLQPILHNAVVNAESLSAPHRPPVAGLGHVLRLTYGIPDLR